MHWKIEIHKHGILVYGHCRVDELCEVAKMARTFYGYGLIDCAGIASRFNANFAFVSEKSHACWCKELGINAQDQKD